VPELPRRAVGMEEGEEAVKAIAAYGVVSWDARGRCRVRQGYSPARRVLRAHHPVTKTARKFAKYAYTSSSCSSAHVSAVW
jgi:hypothetical protein